jgi:hypothetical protein
MLARRRMAAFATRDALRSAFGARRGFDARTTMLAYLWSKRCPVGCGGRSPS